MKNTKKLLALVLAMMMAFSIMAMTASAAQDAEAGHVHTEACECGDEGIMPTGVAVSCPVCGGRAELIQEYDPSTQTTRSRIICLSGCGANPGVS